MRRYRPHRPTLATLGAILAVLCSSCGSGAAQNPASDSDLGAEVAQSVDAAAYPDLLQQDLTPWDIMVPVGCNPETVAINHVSSWPGKGVGIIIRAPAPYREQTRVNAGNYVLASLDGHLVDVAASPFTIERSFVLILFDGFGPPGESQAGEEALAALLAPLDPATHVALYRRCAQLEQLASFTADRGLLTSLVSAGEMACAQAAAGDFEPSSVLADLMAIGGRNFPAIRTLVRLTADDVQPSLNYDEGDIHRYSVGVAPSTAISQLSTIAQEIEDRATAHISLGACPQLEAGAFAELLTPWGAQCPVTLPAALDEEAAQLCDAEAIAGGQRDYPNQVQFHFTEEQRKVFEDFRSTKNQADFELSIRLGDAEPTAATAHLRGQTSLDCKRKSFTVNLESGAARHILPNSATDEFYLISMCKDDRYFQQYTANILARDVGLFPLYFGLVELLIEEETQGVYLLLEKTKEALLEDNSRVRTIVRRRFDPDPKLPEVKYPSGEAHDSPVMDSYWALQEPGELVGEALVDQMSQRMDLDRFLTFLAFHTLMGNGDYVDEAFFISTEAVRGDELVDWYQLIAWDMDDLFSACHHGGKHAMADPFDILFCAEGNIEKAIMGDAAVYARFIDTLEKMMQEQVTHQALEDALQQTEAALLPWFEDPDICQAMDVLLASNPAAVEPAVAKADILKKMDLLRDQYDQNFAKLETSIAAYRQATGGN